MNADNHISPELQAKIDALVDENLKANILMVLSGPGNQTISNEQIFENIVARSQRVTADRAKWRQWTDEEVTAFIARYRQEMPEDFSEFLRQEREDNKIDADLAWRARQLARKWLPDLGYVDYGTLLGRVRDHVRAHKI